MKYIKEGGTYFRDTDSGANGKWHRNLWEEFNELRNIDQKYCSPNYYDVKLNKCKAKTGTSLRFWENKAWIKEIDAYGWFQWYFTYFLER